MVNRYNGERGDDRPRPPAWQPPPRRPDLTKQSGRRPLPPPAVPDEFRDGGRNRGSGRREYPPPPPQGFPRYDGPPQPERTQPRGQSRRPPAPRSRPSAGAPDVTVIAAAAGGVVLVVAAGLVAFKLAHHGSGNAGLPQAAAASAAPVSAVPGSSNNEYVTGPFTVTLKGISALPAKYDAVNEQGQPVPESCAVVSVMNTSADFTGWVAPHVEFVAGQTLSGQVLETDAADPTGGDSGGDSDTLSPGQAQVLYACPQQASTPTAVQAQLVTVTYGTPGQGTLSGVTVSLKY